jgi:hypothetical protein
MGAQSLYHAKDYLGEFFGGSHAGSLKRAELRLRKRPPNSDFISYRL